MRRLISVGLFALAPRLSGARLLRMQIAGGAGCCWRPAGPRKPLTTRASRRSASSISRPCCARPWRPRRSLRKSPDRRLRRTPRWLAWSRLAAASRVAGRRAWSRPCEPSSRRSPGASFPPPSPTSCSRLPPRLRRRAPPRLLRRQRHGPRRRRARLRRPPRSRPCYGGGGSHRNPHAIPAAVPSAAPTSAETPRSRPRTISIASRNSKSRRGRSIRPARSAPESAESFC